MPEKEGKLLELEKRIEVLEKMVLSKNKTEWEKNYSGLKGGMQLLVDNNFFTKPRNLGEVESELKREGYHYPKSSISKILSVDLTNKQKLLNRVKEEKIWKYVIRK
ncbi:MAG: hypothetical protein OER82_12445 [Nitrosopumilus sp.]|nr:hypothetical protein [Nitrosopumilus sp.]